MYTVSRVLSCLAVLLGAGVGAGSAQSYHVVNTYTLGGDGGWDYLALDTVGHRLFIAWSWTPTTGRSWRRFRA